MSDLFVALVDYGEHDDREFVTSLDLQEFYTIIINKLLEHFGSDYPEITEIVPNNSELYMSEYSNDEYQDTIAEITNFLSGDSANPVVSFLRVLPNIVDNELIGFETDLV